jgi:hypothetical protein
MRSAALILGVLGIFGPGVLGYIWHNQSAQLDALIMKDAKQLKMIAPPGFEEVLQNYKRFKQVIVFLFTAVPLGIFALVLIDRGRGLSGGLLMLAASIGPILLAPDHELRIRVAAFCGLMVLSGLFGLFARPRVRKPRKKSKARPEQDNEDEIPPPRKKTGRKRIVEDEDDE